jgi:hypothetical protein
MWHLNLSPNKRTPQTKRHNAHKQRNLLASSTTTAFHQTNQKANNERRD